jgi:hypothetical protein
LEGVNNILDVEIEMMPKEYHNSTASKSLANWGLIREGRQRIQSIDFWDEPLLPRTLLGSVLRLRRRERPGNATVAPPLPMPMPFPFPLLMVVVARSYTLSSSSSSSSSLGLPRDLIVIVVPVVEVVLDGIQFSSGRYVDLDSLDSFQIKAYESAKGY